LELENPKQCRLSPTIKKMASDNKDGSVGLTNNTRVVGWAVEWTEPRRPTVDRSKNSDRPDVSRPLNRPSSLSGNHGRERIGWWSDACRPLGETMKCPS
jgi:hypothetical protein